MEAPTFFCSNPKRLNEKNSHYFIKNFVRIHGVPGKVQPVEINHNLIMIQPVEIIVKKSRLFINDMLQHLACR
jgi:hypothetical protein